MHRENWENVLKDSMSGNLEIMPKHRENREFGLFKLEIP